VNFDLDAVAQATSGTRSGPNLQICGASIDSRTICAGELFIPIIAERDGHDFIPAAIGNGAVAYLTSQPASDEHATSAVLVSDTSRGLMDLGAFAHRQLKATATIGVTGSVGKTSVKDLTAAALTPSHNVHANPGSFNNELGLPLTLLSAPDNTEILVLEMGARGLDQISKLAALTSPDIGVVTAVAMVHTELFGSIDEVARAKSELIAALPSTGTAVLNADDERVIAMQRITDAQVLSYGFGSADVQVENAALREDLCPSFTLKTPAGSALVKLRVAGLHNAGNAAAAAAAALATGASLESIVMGLQQARISPSRMAVHNRPSGAVVIDDAYNANPTSMRAALDALSALPHKNKVAVVGLMAELGAEERSAHEQIADYATALDIRLIVVATDLYGLEAVDDWQQAAELLGRLDAHDAVLVKGSFVAGLRALSSHLTSADV
jgi:UDP-N-acetylmuramoyl-tripeptide--D-alanyl-D-alanine ligase